MPAVRREFDFELQDLKKKILTMGGMVEAMVGDSLSALVTRDTPLADSVQQKDAAVDRLEMDVDEAAFHIIAIRQPTAGDLRLINSTANTPDITASKMPKVSMLPPKRPTK